MKTSNTIAIQSNSKVRLGLTLLGIVTAIICSLTLLHDTSSMEHVATMPSVNKTLSIVPADVSLGNVGVSVISAVMPIR